MGPARGGGEGAPRTLGGALKVQVVTVNDVHPPGFGGAARVFHLCRALARTEEVRVACVVGSRSRAPRHERVEGLEITRVKPYHPTLTHYLERAGLAADILGYDLYRRWPRPLLDALDPAADVWQVDSPVLGPYLERAPRGALRVYASHNVEAEWFERVGAPVVARRRWARRLAAIEARTVAVADLVLAVSEEDGAEFARRYGAPREKIEVAENGYEPEQSRPPTAAERESARRALGVAAERVAVFVGSDFPHNRLAVEDLFRHVVPRLPALGCRLVLAGGASAGFRERARREGGGSVLCLGPVADLRPVLWAADLALHPVTTGAGSNVKLPMYLGAALPVLSTPFGVRGFPRLATYVEQAPVEGFADRLARPPLYDPAAAEAVAWYSWGEIGRRLARAYRERKGG